MVLMKHVIALSLVASVLLLSGCKRKDHDAQHQAQPAAPAEVKAPVAQAEPTADDADRAKKQSLLEYATMEDQYINDPHAQWANSASASSTFGDDNGKPSEVNAPSNVIGPLHDKSWTNNHQDVGFDWLQAGFAKPVLATEVRVVFERGQGVEAINKIELQGTDGQWTTIWSGLSDAKIDNRGSRTWFVRKFDKTAAPVNGVKITIANNVQRGYKVINAVQLVGE